MRRGKKLSILRPHHSSKHHVPCYSGTLHGLFRVRGFTQDDAHIFCLPEQLEQEIISILSLIEDILGKFGFQSKSSFEIMLSTRPKDSVGSDEIWQKATDALIHSLKAKGWPYSVDEGGGAFYGPKIDIKIKDAIGRKWQCSTVQCDFNLPERFELEYTLPAPPGSTTTGAEATTVAVARKARPIMVHRAIFGSLERFFGILIENSAGELPFWIAPVQLRLLPVVEDALPYCEELQAKAKAEYGLRVEIDRTGNRIAKQIRTAIAEKIPIAAIIGMNEVKAGKMTLRLQKLGDLGGSYQANDVLQKLRGLAKKGANELKVEMFEDIPSQ
jgi:threonyl-tRNA synthetase